MDTDSEFLKTSNNSVNMRSLVIKVLKSNVRFKYKMCKTVSL